MRSELPEYLDLVTGSEPEPMAVDEQQVEASEEPRDATGKIIVSCVTFVCLCT